MSNKNLKVYKIQFITEVKTLHLKVKFPCEIKMVWRRSNQIAETKKVKLIDGKVEFNETLKLNVNMYFDTIINKFVEKKCLYSFMIYTEKGEKSAGTFMYDLSEFFNKRIYETENSFPLQKCPVKDTKVDMKIWYEESVESGYDSMSQISMSSQMDISNTEPLNMSEMNESQENIEKQSSSTVSQTTTNNSAILKVETPEKKSAKKGDSELESLDKSNIAERDQSQKNQSQTDFDSKRSSVNLSGVSNETNQKIGDNIKGINEVSNKLNKFVGKFKDNFKYSLEEKERVINKLTEQLLSVKQKNQNLETELSRQKQQNIELQSELASFRTAKESEFTEQRQRSEQLERKLENERKNVEKLENRLSAANEKGQQEGDYLKELKQEHQSEVSRLQQQIATLNGQISSQSIEKTELQTKHKNTQSSLDELDKRYESLLSRHQSLESQLARREGEIQATRVNLERAYENLYESLGELLEK